MRVAWLLVGCVLSSMVCQAAGREGVVRLNERAGVAGEAIRLSDFLPEETQTAVRAEANMVELGRSPQLGSTRVLSREKIVQGLKEHPELLREISIPEQVMAFRQGLPISSESIQKTILSFAGEQKWSLGGGSTALEFSGQPGALISDPELKVESAGQDKLRHKLKFVVRCVRREVCGAFTVSAKLMGNFAEGPPAHVGAGLKRSPRAQGEILAHAGRPAMLSMQGGNMRIFMRVICLERGTLGQTIRAREASGHRIFRAEVVGAGALRANL